MVRGKRGTGMFVRSHGRGEWSQRVSDTESGCFIPMHGVHSWRNQEVAQRI
jgi:hypothetical protein